MAGEAAAAGGIPGLQLSAGPSQASGSSGGTTSTGAFMFKSADKTLWQQVFPFALLGVTAWLIWKK